MPQQTQTTSALHLVLERISSLFRAQMRDTANEHDLRLVQLEALVYLSVANRYSDTTMALAEYLGLTKGTVSQTVRALERRGLIEKEADANDGRVLHCHLTEEGHAIAAAAHPARFLHDLPSSQQQQTLSAALAVLRALQAGRQFKSFGQCDSCRHFLRDGSPYRCGLTSEALGEDDAIKICREHEAPMPEARSSA